jgi:hypothetical protein
MARLNLDLKTLAQRVGKALQIGSVCPSEAQWEKCSGACESLLGAAMKQEIGSTAFMLKVIADSIIRPDGQPHRLQIALDPSFLSASGAGASGACRVLTGRWKDDEPFLHLVLPSSKRGRLVMGFGPSASGKTHWAKTVLVLLKEADPLFPDVFFSDDGGLVRESSATYQFAKEMAHRACLAGFKNLHDGLFPSGDVKKAMEAYWLRQSRRGTPVSLYVPETLGTCDFRIPGIGVTVPGIRSCKAKLKTFLDITGDRDAWIGLLIWQHKTAADHGKVEDNMSMFHDEAYACVGCTESGRSREKSEGKPYSSGAYEQSMKNGRVYLAQAPGGQYEIHNAGRKGGVSVLFDTSARGRVSDRFSAMMRQKAARMGVDYVDRRWANTMASLTFAPAVKPATRKSAKSALKPVESSDYIIGQNKSQYDNTGQPRPELNVLPRDPLTYNAQGQLGGRRR